MTDSDMHLSSATLSSFFPGNSEMAQRMRAFDWASSHIGRPEAWPRGLAIGVSIMLTSRQPMFIWWGNELTNLYNDAYSQFLHARHPWALGQSARIVWHEIWPEIGPLVAFAMSQDAGTYNEALRLIVLRTGVPEEMFVTFSYSPVRDDAGAIGGIFCPVTEETGRIVGERRLAVLREVGLHTINARTRAEACTLAIEALDTDPFDVPFAFICEVHPEAGTADLLGATASLRDMDAASILQQWPFERILGEREPCMIEDLAPLANILGSMGDHPPGQALGIRLAGPDESGHGIVMIIGINLLRPLDDQHRGFVELLGSEVSSSIARVQAYEGERRRADMLAEIDRAKTTFFSNISHEFRTPITLMLGPLQDALSDHDAPLAGPQVARIEMAQRNGQRLLRLVNTLLDFARIQAGRMEATYEPTDLAALTIDLASNFRSLCEQAGLELRVRCEPANPIAFVDRDMWEKIVLNLLSNAFKFTLSGSIDVELSDGDGSLCLTVTDTGVGIAAPDLHRIFERFQRIEDSRGRSYEGSGIGLSLVRELVMLHDGEITAESTPGHSSTFRVRIPQGLAHLDTTLLAGASRNLAASSTAGQYLHEASRWIGPDVGSQVQATAAVAAPIGPARLRILIADDNADMRSYLVDLLSPYGDITAVRDGRQALDQLMAERYDLLLTDVMMPNVDGLALMRAVRAEPALRFVAVILLSARAGVEARAEGLEAGADEYLVKPFSARELLARLGSCLALVRLRADAVAQSETALRVSGEQLERHVAERTAELKQALESLQRETAGRLAVEEQLRQSEKLKAVGQLSGGIAHDFNNLLGVIIGSVEILLAEMPDHPVYSDILKQILESAVGGADLTRRLLAFATQQPLQGQQADLNELLPGLVAMLRRTLGETISIELKLPANAWLTRADPSRISDALLNLAVNARDAMPEGGELVVEVCNFHCDRYLPAYDSDVAPGEYVLLIVSDTGAGMSREVRQRAIEPFFTTKPKASGTGLGLSTIYGFVKQSNGHMGIASEPGRGTVVTLYLPRAVSINDEARRSPRDATIPAGTEAVLLVDDNPMLLRVTERHLVRLGYRVDTAADGPAALAALSRNNGYDLLVTDVVMPNGISGRQLAARARLLHPSMKVLLITGHDAGESPTGTDDLPLLRKPFHRRQLASALRDALNGSQILRVQPQAGVLSAPG